MFWQQKWNNHTARLKGSATPERSTCSTVFAKPFCTCVIIYNKPAIWIYSFIHIFFLCLLGVYRVGRRKQQADFSDEGQRWHTFIHRMQFPSCRMSCYCCFQSCCNMPPKVKLQRVCMCKVWRECAVFHISGHVCPGYKRIISVYLYCLCEGEEICDNVV